MAFLSVLEENKNIVRYTSIVYLLVCYTSIFICSLLSNEYFASCSAIWFGVSLIVLVFCSPSILVFHHFYPNITPGVHRNSNKTKNMHRVRRNSTKRRGSIQIYIDKIKSCICTIVIHYIYNAKYKEDNIQKNPWGGYLIFIPPWRNLNGFAGLALHVLNEFWL